MKGVNFRLHQRIIEFFSLYAINHGDNDIRLIRINFLIAKFLFIFYIKEYTVLIFYNKIRKNR